jgi:hypothetical protein
MPVNHAENDGHDDRAPLLMSREARPASVSGRLRGYWKTVSLGQRRSRDRALQPAETSLISENKCSRVAFAKDTHKVLCLRWLERILIASDALSHRQQPVLAQTGSCFQFVGMTAETTHQMK